jgi:hypothetical protein
MNTRDDTRVAERIAEAKAAARQRRWRRGGAEDPDALRYSPILWISTLMLTGLLLAGLIVWYEMRHPPPPGLATPAGVTNEGGKQAGITVAGTGRTVVEVYTDLACAACRGVDAETGPILDQLAATNRIRLVWHPLGSPGAPAAYATRAANAVACAADFGKLEPYADLLFTNQPPAGGAGLSDDQLIDVAGHAGLKRGARAPAIYVDGRRLEQPTPEAILAAVG